MKTKPIRCPKCQSLKIVLIEHIECFATWFPGEEEAINSPGSYFKLSGNCHGCGKTWTVPGEIMINDELLGRLSRNKELLEAQKP